MTELVKWAWIILLMILFGGWYSFAIAGVLVIVYALILWLRPEWAEKDPEVRKNIKRNRKEKAVMNRFRELIREERYPENCTAIEKVREGKKTVNIYWLFLEDGDFDNSTYEDKLFRIDFKLAQKLDSINLVITQKSKEIMAIRWNESQINDNAVEVVGFNSEQFKNDCAMELNQPVVRQIKLTNVNKDGNLSKLIKLSEFGDEPCINIKLKVVYNDNITEIVRICLRLKHISETHKYWDHQVRHYIGEEKLPQFGSESWITYITENDVHFDYGNAFVVTRVSSGMAMLTMVDEVPQRTPIILKRTSRNYAKIVDIPPTMTYTNLLSVSNEATESGVYVLTTKSKGTGFYKWDGESLGDGKVFLPKATKSIDDYIGLKVLNY